MTTRTLQVEFCFAPDGHQPERGDELTLTARFDRETGALSCVDIRDELDAVVTLTTPGQIAGLIDALQKAQALPASHHPESEAA